MGAGGVPFAPGTGKELVFCGSLVRPCPGGSAVGAIVAGIAGAVVPAFAAGLFARGLFARGLFARLGGSGSLPCWISITRCCTFLGSCGVTVVVCGVAAGVGEPGAGAAGAGWLMTLLITVVLWMLL